MSERHDYIVVGGGLAAGILAWRLRQARADLSFILLERESALGGFHTWSFHSSDVGETALAWLRPLLTKSWPHYDVHFPRVNRRLDGGYHSIRSEDFHERLFRALGERARLGCEVRELRADRVTLADGRVFEGTVIDARGFGPASAPCGYQSFFGQDLRLERPHRLSGPLLMDATCEQRGGFRFFYLLPWSEDTLLVEDTRYIDEPALSSEECRAEIARYVQARGWRIRDVLREEKAALPIPLDRETAGAAAAPRIGVRAGFFHATTGYSLPDAVRVAERLCAIARPTPLSVSAALSEYARAHERRQRYFRFLNRMLFRGAAPDERYRLLQRFYQMPAGTVRRFYAGAMSPLDRARVLCGKPPIPLRAAFDCLFFPAGETNRIRNPQEKTA